MVLIPGDIRALRGRPLLQADETANDSDKTLTAPANSNWLIQHVWVELTSTAAAGNRQITVELLDDAGTPDVIAAVAAGATQAANLTRKYLFAPHLPDLTAFRAGDLLMTPLPPVVLPAGYKIRVYDSAAIAAAADDMIVQAMLIAQTPA